MKTRLTCLIVLLGLGFPLFVPAQNASPDILAVREKLSATLESRFKAYPQEKVFVHVSQSVFLGGQTIWYKAYVQAYGKPSDLSKIVYVRLSNEKGRLIKQDKLPLKSSTAFGNIELPDTLRSGWYRLQAFTAWQLNFDRNNIFSQVLYIQNPKEQIDPEKLKINTPDGYQVSFYPEGGKLIDGTIGNIAFKASDENGMPIAVTGQVFEGQKNELAAISTVHDGMGSFSFETHAGSTYTAQVHFPDNSVQNIALPRVESSGMFMRVNPGPPGEIDFVLANVGQAAPIQNVLMQAVQADGVAVAYPLQLSRGFNVFSFDKSDFSTGVVHFGLFDEAGRLIAERSVFVDRNDRPAISIKADTLSRTAGTFDALTFGIRDANGKPLQVNVSVSVTDADMGGATSDNLGSFVQLSSEIPSYIPNPGYYLKNNSDTISKQLDLVLLTAGAHYPEWDNIITNNPVQLRHAVERSQFIAGRIENYNPAENLKLKMMITAADSGKMMAYAEPDDKGMFKVGNFDSPGNADVLYEAVNRQNHKQAVDVTFFNELLDTAKLGTGKLQQAILGNPGINVAYIDSAASGQLAYYRAKGIMLKTVDIKEVKKTPLQIIIDRHVKRLPADVSFDFDMVHQSTSNSQNILDYLLGRVPGLTIVYTLMGRDWAYHGKSSIQIDQKGNAILMKPYFYIDEMYVDEDEIDHMSMTDVALIRFVPPPVWYAPLNGGFVGAVMIYTKKFEDDKDSYKGMQPESQHFSQFTFNGFSATREFTPAATRSNQKAGLGFHTTIFWAHDVQTDATGVAHLHFSANDKAKRYRVVVQGMDKDGRPLYAEEIFTADN